MDFVILKYQNPLVKAPVDLIKSYKRQLYALMRTIDKQYSIAHIPLEMGFALGTKRK